MNLKQVILSDASTEAKVSAIAILLDKELPKLTEQVDTVKKLKGEQGEQGLKGDKGDRGEPGKDGKDGRDGIDGSTGKDGIDGEDGISVVDAKVDFDDTLVLTLSNGKEINVGEVKGEKGENGRDGNTGANGIGVPTGGTSGQVLAKNSGADYDTKWVTGGGGGGSGTVTSVSGTGTVSGISLSGTVTTSGNLTLGGALDLSSPPAIGGTSASTGRFTTVTSTVATGTAPFTVASTTPVTNLSIGGNAATATNVAYSGLTGTVPTWNQNTTGSAATLTTTRAIYGNNFDGSAALTQIIASTYGGTGNGFTKFSGATTAEKTYTLPDATTTILTTNAAVTPAQGGTGQTTYTDGQLLIGNSTGNTLTKTTLTAGAGVSITNGSGSISIASPLAKSTTIYTSGNGVYTAPTNTQWVKITVVGPGAPGGSGVSRRGAGGGAGGVAIKWVAMTAGQTLVYYVGTYGFFNSTVTSGSLTISDITAACGVGGNNATYNAGVTIGATGGAASGGDINITGGQGGAAYGASTSVTTQISGAGGNCPGFGSGGSVVGGAIANGLDANGYGGGGGGAVGSVTAGNGGAGIIIFEAF